MDGQRFALKDAFFFETNVDPSGSATINLELDEGQEVQIENWGSSIVFGTYKDGHMESWFTGHLLYAL